MSKQWHNWRMRGILLRYRDGEMPVGQAQRLTHHLADCEICRECLNRWKAAEQILVQHAPIPEERTAQDAQNMFALARARAQAQIQTKQQTVRERKIGAMAAACASAVLWVACSRLQPLEPSAGTDTARTVSSSWRKNAGFALKAEAGRKSTGATGFVAVKNITRIKRHDISPVAAKKRATQHSIATTVEVETNGKHRDRRRRNKRTLAMLLAARQRSEHSWKSSDASALIKVDVDADVAVAQTGDEANGAGYESGESLSLLAQNMRGISPDSHLLITVTDAAEKSAMTQATGDRTPGSNDVPPFSMQSRPADADRFGMATVSVLQVDDAGTQIWRVCSVAQNTEGVTTVRCATAWQNRREPISMLAITMATVQGDRK